MIGCKNNEGYTLVEAIVALGIFVLIAMLAAGIFTSILGAQTKTVKQQDVASQLRFFQDAVSRDVREARTLSCNNGSGKSTAFTLSLNGDSTSPITYSFDASAATPQITKTQGTSTSPVTDFELKDFQVFCNDIGNGRSFVTINIWAKGITQPYQISITPRSGVLQ